MNCSKAKQRVTSLFTNNVSSQRGCPGIEVEWRSESGYHRDQGEEQLLGTSLKDEKARKAEDQMERRKNNS